ncbi:MAG: hypothetical protein HY718_18385, partial [Planctomycetes bacterium]|nr:hypothetical protein [Planctomycetota bacterium]
AEQQVVAPQTVAAVAAHWIRLLTGMDVEDVATQPAAERADRIRQLKETWRHRPTGSAAASSPAG